MAGHPSSGNLACENAAARVGIARERRAHQFFFVGKSSPGQYRHKTPYKANILPENPNAASYSGVPALADPHQRQTQPPTAGGLSWWLWPLRGGHGRGLRRFAAVMAEVFAPSWWSRRRSFIHRHKNNAKNRFTCDFRLFHHRNLFGVCASSRHLRRQANFSAKSSKRRRKKPKKPPPLAVGGGHVAVFAAPPWRSRRSFADTAGGLSWRSFLFFQVGG